MITVKFLKACKDKYTGEHYAANSTKTVNNIRGAELLRVPFIVEVKEEAPAEKPATEDKPKRQRKTRKTK